MCMNYVDRTAKFISAFTRLVRNCNQPVCRFLCFHVVVVVVEGSHRYFVVRHVESCYRVIMLSYLVRLQECYACNIASETSQSVLLTTTKKKQITTEVRVSSPFILSISEEEKLYVDFSVTSDSVLNASLYASNNAFTRVRSATSASSSFSRSPNRSGLYSDATSRFWTCCEV